MKKKTALKSQPVKVAWTETEVTKEAQRLMQEATLKGEMFTAKAELQRAKRTLEIIDLIIADKKIDAIKLLREPYDIKVSVRMWKAEGDQ